MQKQMWAVVISIPSADIVLADWALVVAPLPNYAADVEWERTKQGVHYDSVAVACFARERIIRELPWPTDEQQAYESEVLVTNYQYPNEGSAFAGLPQQTASYLAGIYALEWDDEAGVYRTAIWPEIQELIRESGERQKV